MSHIESMTMMIMMKMMMKKMMTMMMRCHEITVQNILVCHCHRKASLTYPPSPSFPLPKGYSSPSQASICFLHSSIPSFLSSSIPSFPVNSIPIFPGSIFQKGHH